MIFKIEKVAEIAANWWGECLEEKYRNSCGGGENEAEISLYCTLQAAENGPSEESITKFKEVLKKDIIAALKSSEYFRYPFIMKVDYIPDQKLQKACIDAGIYLTYGTFPFKASLRISADKCKVIVCKNNGLKEVIHDTE